MLSLSQIYQQKIDSKELTFDRDHQRLVEQLEGLESYFRHPPQTRWWKRKPVPVKGFYIYGEVGRGKSMVMDLFFSHVPTTAKRRVHFHHFMLEVHEFLHQRRRTRHQSQPKTLDGDLIAFVDKLAAELKLLCFDEFQVKDVADAMLLGRLFTALIARGMVVIMTSNIMPDQLYKNGLQRERFLPFIALLKQQMHVVYFGGAIDYRLQVAREGQTYFSPADAAADKAIEALYTHLRGEHEEIPRQIEAKGRIIPVPRAAANVAMFDFKLLCAEARSALDYLELIKHFDIFIVQHVPVLNDEHPNETMRFITLIDTLYDHRKVLILSAAAGVQDLYQGAQHKEIFKRTTSRLIEMQSGTYAAAV